MVELLSPAGNFAALNAAISNGADSVYIGIAGFNLRANKGNFQVEDLKNAVNFCHDSNVKLYVCTNTIMKDGDIANIRKLLPKIKSECVDAVIVSDLGALRVVNENNLAAHMSVQANISNMETIKTLMDLGVNRVILSRELSLNEIKNIKKSSPIEVEVFVHGAMCIAVSGRCFLSSYFYDKSANCGECLQPCREEWRLISKNNLKSEDHLKMDHLIKDDESHFLSPRDLCMVEHVPELIEAGVDAFKIEGRNRAADYVATVTNVYRDAINSYYNDWCVDKDWIGKLRKVFNRGFDTGFYFKTPYKTSDYNESTYMKKDLGIVTNYYSHVSAAELKLHDNLKLGDEIIITGPTTGVIIQKAESLQINGENVTRAFKGENVAIKVKDKARRNDNVYKRIKKS